VWDTTFYGLRLFSGPIFDDINPSGDLIKNNGFLLLNNVIALVGYYCAAKVSYLSCSLSSLCEWNGTDYFLV
jgi:hypothetical protein